MSEASRSPFMKAPHDLPIDPLESLRHPAYLVDHKEGGVRMIEISRWHVLAIVGGLIYGALYCAAVWWTALAMGRPGAVYAALTTMGVTYVSFIVQLGAFPPIVARAAVILSIALGVLAGLLLLV